MKPMKNILIAGLGAIGGAYAMKFYQKKPFQLRVLASRQRKERYQKDGFIINGQRVDFNYADPESANTEPADIILVAVKDYGLDEAISQMSPFVGEHTILLSLMNGITSEERLAKAFGWDRVLYGLCMGIDGFRDGNVIKYHQYGTISFGKGDNTVHAPEVKRVAALFDQADINYKIPENMLYELWYKFMVNVGINQASAIIKSGFRAFQEIPEAHALMRSAMMELIQISQKNGINLTEKDMDQWDAVLANMPPESRPSMLNDLESGRKTEVDMLGGTVCRLGKEYGVPTPVNEAFYRSIRAMETLLL